MAWRMERIHHLGAVQGDMGEVVLFLVLDELEVHRFLLRFLVAGRNRFGIYGCVRLSLTRLLKPVQNPPPSPLSPPRRGIQFGIQSPFQPEGWDAKASHTAL